MIHFLPDAPIRLGGKRPLAWVAALAFAVHAQSALATAPGGSSRHVRVLATRFHHLCPLLGQRTQTRAVDSQTEWESVLPGNDVAHTTGREVKWSRERVIVYATSPSPHTTLLESPAQGLMLSRGILYWPITERASTEQSIRGSRSCLISVVTRAYWQNIKVIDPSIIRRRGEDAH